MRHPRIQRLVLFAGVYDLKELPFCEIGTVIGFVSYSSIVSVENLSDLSIVVRFRLTPEDAKNGSCSASELEELNIRVQILIAGKVCDASAARRGRGGTGDTGASGPQIFF